MTVAELIEALKELPGDTVVVAPEDGRLMEVRHVLPGEASEFYLNKLWHDATGQVVRLVL